MIVGGATENTSYYFANKELIAKKDNSGNKTYFHNDHLGSTSVTTNQAGSIAETTTYDPWGEIRSGGTQNKFLYTGQEKDSETGLNYYNARYYSSDIRRFTQPDDIIQNVYNPQDLNRYSYVRNNPLRYTDPTGNYAQLLYYGAMYATMVSSSPDLQSDMQFLAMDTSDFQNDPSVGKGIGVGLAALSVATPNVPNSGISRTVAKAVDNVGQKISNPVKSAINNSFQAGKQKFDNIPSIKWKGNELIVGSKLRIAPYGNPGAKLKDGKPNTPARLPHYHLKQEPKPNDKNARTSGSWHRPWETLFKGLFKKK